MKALIFILLAGCAIDADVDTEVDESEVIYCPDDLCEPTPTQTSKPDLVPLFSQDCRYIYVGYPNYWELAFTVRNAGNERSGIHTARVSMRSSWNDEWRSRYFQLSALDPDKGTGFRLEPTCWNSAFGCEVRVTADYANANVESNESNNTVTMKCPRAPQL